MTHADDRAQQAHRHDQDHRQRQRPALVLRRQHQEHEHHRQHEDVAWPCCRSAVASRASSVHSCRIDCGSSLVGRLLPCRSIAWPELVPGAGVAVDRRPTGTCCSASTITGPLDVADVDQRRPAAPSRRRSLRTLSCLRSSTCLRNCGVGLHVDLPGAAEAVEVVDVERAEVDLQRVEDLAHRHAHASWPWSRSMSRYSQGVLARKLVNRPCRPGVVVAVGDDRRRRPLAASSRPMSPRSSIDDLEAAGRAQALDRRGAEDVDQRRRGSRRWNCSLQLGGDGVAGQVAAAAVVEVVEHDVHRAEVRARWRSAGATGRRWRPCARRPASRGRSPRSAASPPAVRSTRRRVGQLDVDEQVALVLRRDEARRACR